MNLKRQEVGKVNGSLPKRKRFQELRFNIGSNVKTILMPFRLSLISLKARTGVAFLYRLVTVAHLEFTKVGVASIHNVSNFLEACGLSPFIGSSYATQRRISNKMDTELIRFGKSEHDRLATQMPPKAITLAEGKMRLFIRRYALLPWSRCQTISFWKNTPRIEKEKLGTHQLKMHLPAYRSR